MKKNSITKIFIPLILGTIVGLIIMGSMNYGELVKPDFAPPKIIFPIVWSILYLLMGITYYLIYEEKNQKLFIIQLIFNLLWPIIFFSFHQYVGAFIWILILLILVKIMIHSVFKENKFAAYLQFPYLLWLVFATILNYSIMILN